jgi:broad specificity phosphatase PhoE
MPSAKLVIGGAAATTALGIRVARSLYARWRLLPEADRRRIESLAEDLKAQALALRGASDRAGAEADLNAANETFAAALVETAEADPELDELEVRELREDLRRELERLATADIKAWRTRREATPPPG